jgi:peptidoglycan L-alanyl-D-glutamate endopeptidase CwlK
VIDERSAKHIKSLLPEVQDAFTEFLLQAKELVAKEGLDYKAISGLRSWEDQAVLYAKGRTSPGPIVTNAKPGSSMHNFGLAIDCGVFKGNVYMDDSTPADQKVADLMHKHVSTLCAKHNLRWGGNFKKLYDAPHFEYNTPYTLADLCVRRGKGQSLIA